MSITEAPSARAQRGAAAKARQYLTEGRLIVLRCGPGYVDATCRGDGAIWHPRYRTGAWECDCPCRTDQCSHLHAVRLITAPDLQETPS